MKKKVLFILPTLTAGGAERVISYIAQNIDQNKFESKLLITGYKKDAAYSINGIEVKFLEKGRVLNAIPKIFLYLIKNKPQFVLSSIGHLNTVMGLMSPFFIKTKFIIREASVISSMEDVYKESSNKKSFSIHSYLSHKSYKMIDKIVCQSKDMAQDFINIYNVPKHKAFIINNPITNLAPLKPINNNKNSHLKFITVGRLSKEKGHIRVINLLSKLDFPFQYTIIGDGPYKDEIFKVISDKKMTDKITYIPFTKEVSKYMSLNDLFLQGSYVEGFPNTVLESCIVGTPVLAFNVPGGTKEIISHNENGYLAESEDEFLSFLNKRVFLSLSPEKIRNSVISKFSQDKIVKQYESLFN
ncbi:glycosyltransferase [Algibacter sp. PT7-4]|uniref:glycosyltransferase n=1 Tax=Algibacter ulvanivorans TaxID=3400999 RepID=UPI003AB0DB5A